MLEAIPLKHKAPLRCRLHTMVFGKSVSVVLIRCLLGCKRVCKKCSGCQENTREMAAEAFSKGVAKGLKYKMQIKGRL